MAEIFEKYARDERLEIEQPARKKIRRCHNQRWYQMRDKKFRSTPEMFAIFLKRAASSDVRRELATRGNVYEMIIRPEGDISNETYGPKGLERLTRAFGQVGPVDPAFNR